MVTRVSSTPQKPRLYVSSFYGFLSRIVNFYEADWIDGGRDVANFLLHFLPPAPIGAVLPVHLQRVSAEETSLRIQRGFKDRKFVAVGHSYGGCIS